MSKAKNLIELVDETAGLEVIPVGVTGNVFNVKINGTEYGFEALSGKIDDVYKSFTGQLKYSAGRALAWLKKNAKQVSGGKLSTP